MPTWTGIPQDTIENMFVELQNRMSWIMARLDSKNIKEIDGDIVNVKNICKTETGQALKIKINNGYLEVYNGSTYIGKVQLT